MGFHDCQECLEWFTMCPCCSTEFCPKCGKLANEEEEEEEE